MRSDCLPGRVLRFWDGVGMKGYSWCSVFLNDAGAFTSAFGSRQTDRVDILKTDGDFASH